MRPSHIGPSLGRIGIALMFAAVTLAALGQPVAAQQISVIRDAETESMIRDFAVPLMRAAGLPRRNPKVVLVNDRQFNAFVVEDGTVYVNYGTILDVENPNELKAVLAHEIGHVAGGHLARIRDQAQAQAVVQAISMVLGVGAMAAASRSQYSGDVGRAAAAFMLAAQSASMGEIASFRRSEESAADNSALHYLQATHQSGKGLVDVLKLLKKSEVVGSSATAFLRTHPLAQDRINQVEHEARSLSYYGASDSATDIRRLALVKAKLTGFLEGQQMTLTHYPNSDKSLPARYARIIAAYKAGGAISAAQLMPGLIAADPENPYFHELYGQILYETGKATAALAPLHRAVELAHPATQIRILYAQALVDAGGRANLNEAVGQLNRAANDGEKSAWVYTQLSRAYGGLGQQGEATLAAAEAAFANDNKAAAFGLARKAQEQLKKGSPAWLRADDILQLNS
jgi:predicted Zn-dependent protease